MNENILDIIIPFSYFESYTYYDVKCIKLNESSIHYEFVPIDNIHIPKIIELKADKPIYDEINQIKDKDYSNVFKGYKGKILLLGITYDSSTLKHESKIEYIEL